MQYEFITDLSEKEYFKLIDKKKNIHYKTDISWSISQGIYTVLYVGLKLKKSFLCCAKIDIVNHNNNIYFTGLLEKLTITTTTMTDTGGLFSHLSFWWSLLLFIILYDHKSDVKNSLKKDRLL